MIIKGLILLSILLSISCSSDIKKDILEVKVETNSSVYIESGTNIIGMKVKTYNIQKNSRVLQNNTINTNENGTIRIGK